MDLTSYFGKKRAAPARPRPYRPMLECLEDRCLLSGGFNQVNLTSDVPGAVPVTDPNLVNPWGIVATPTGPVWIAENGSGVSDIVDGSGALFSLVVPVPAATSSGSSPTGTVFNGGAAFVVSEKGTTAPSRFLFANEDGTISGWSAVVDPNHALLVVNNSASGADYTGLTLATDSTGSSFLYAADFSHGTIDVFDSSFNPVTRPASFQDPSLPGGYAPFNIQDINDLLYVTYAQQNENRNDEVAGAGKGFIDVYDSAGNLVRRLASQGPLDAPWGLALAPASFGPYGGAVLVGNNGDGHISAYDPGSGALLGTLTNDNGSPITIPNLWSLMFGNGHLGGDANTLFFTAGMDHETHGLFGALQAPGQWGAATAGPGGFDPNFPGEPSDYPLPPRSGPVLRASSNDQPTAVADLLPLRESSLVLLPTLSAVTQPSRGSAAPQGVILAGGIAPNEAVLPILPAFSPTLLLPAAEHFQPASLTLKGAVPFTTFLVLKSAPPVPQEVGGQQPVTNTDTSNSENPPLADRATAAADLLTEAPVGVGGDFSSQEQGLTARAPSDQADVLPGAPSQSRTEVAEALALESMLAPAPIGGSWTGLKNLFRCVVLPVGWAYLAAHHLVLHPFDVGHRRSKRAKRCLDPGSESPR